MRMDRFFLMLDAIRDLEEDRNHQLLAIQQYMQVSQSSQESLNRVLFPISSVQRDYWNYNDKGEGISLLRKISGR